MSDFLGTDFKLNDDFDIEFTIDGDIETVSGAECVAQDIRTAISESDIYQFLNDDDVEINVIKSFIEDILHDDPRVDYDSIVINITGIMTNNERDFYCEISFNTITEDNEQNLVFNISDYIKVNEDGELYE